jgi:hypothetical protein
MAKMDEMLQSEQSVDVLAALRRMSQHSNLRSAATILQFCHCCQLQYTALMDEMQQS